MRHGESAQPTSEILRTSKSQPDAVFVTPETSEVTRLSDPKLAETQEELAASRWAWLEPLWKEKGITSDEQWASLAREQTKNSSVDRNTARDWRLAKTKRAHLSTRKDLAKPLGKSDLLV
ncbi:MAG TPA: hypothetical protein VH351_21535 [Bryobacteraceae bacterium]|nr:hypothetical protein [Bryobacteraceae bacterium]